MNTKAASQLLLENRDMGNRDFWYWLKPNQPASRKDANMPGSGLRSCIITFQCD
jgi:hypothetical protein